MRKVSRGAAMHTTQLSGAAAAISLRAASMRRSVSTSLRGGCSNAGCTCVLLALQGASQRWLAGWLAGWLAHMVDDQQQPAASVHPPQLGHRSFNQLHQLLQLSQLQLPAAAGGAVTQRLLCQCCSFRVQLRCPGEVLRGQTQVSEAGSHSARTPASLFAAFHAPHAPNQHAVLALQLIQLHLRPLCGRKAGEYV